MPQLIQLDLRLQPQPFCPRHSARLSVYGDHVQGHLIAHVVQQLMRTGRLTVAVVDGELVMRESEAEIHALLEEATPFCCFLGDAVIEAIETRLVVSADYGWQQD